MAVESSNSISVGYDDLLFVFEAVGSSAPGEIDAYICVNTGRTYLVSAMGDRDEDAPDDIETSDQYIRVPHKNDLDLGRELVFSFVAEYLPGEEENVRDVFRRKGAYGRFRDMLRSHGMTEKWHAFEESAGEKALREWAEENRIQFSDAKKSGS
jgi:Uncharacterised protein family (UPF0158)